MSALKGSADIRLFVENEQDLYLSFSPKDEFNTGVKEYIRLKAACADYNSNIRLIVTCSAPIDEERFRSAVANWILEEKVIFRQESKVTHRMLIGMLVIASVFITLSLSLAQHFSVLSYTIIPVLGTVALSRAAVICLTDVPINKAKQRLLNEWEKNSVIVFEQAGSE